MEFFLFILPVFLHFLISGDLKKQYPEEYSGKKSFSVGVSLFESEMISEAFIYFKNKQEEFPKSAFVQLYLAKCHLYFENFEAAKLCLEKSRRLNNEIRETYFLIALVEYKQKNWEKAYFEFLKASRIHLDKEPLILRYLGELNLKFGNFVEARKNLKIAFDLGDKEAEKLLKGYF